MSLSAKQPALSAPSRKGSTRAEAVVQLILTVTLVFSIAAAATAVSMGFARAQDGAGTSDPNTSLVLAMLAGAIAVMVGLSALAVRLTGRPRQR